MKNLKIVILICLLPGFLNFATNCFAGFGGTTLEFFQKGSSRVFMMDYDYINTVFLGSSEEKKIAETNIGYNFPVASVIRSSGYVFSIGIPMRVNLSFFEKNKEFTLDNLYFDLGFWLQANMSKSLSIRLYPYLHRSAYLIPQNVSTNSYDKVNNNLIYLELLFAPDNIKGLEVKGAGGYYYKTEVRDRLRGVLDFDFFYEVPLKIPVTPVFLIKNHLLYERNFRYGVEGAIGVEMKSSSLRGLGIFLRLFDTPHPGVYFYNNTTGLGADLKFYF